MTTANELISRSLRLMGVQGVGRRTLTANEAADGLEALNGMLESFSLERMMVYQILEENFPLVAGTASYTIGSGGTFSTIRPIKIESAFIPETNACHNLSVLSQDRCEYSPDNRAAFHPFALTSFPHGYMNLVRLHHDNSG